MTSDPAHPPPGLSSFFREKEFWVLLLGGILFFYRPLFLGETFYYRDLYLLFFSQKRLWAEIVQSGEFPLWDPYLNGGQPFLAEIGNGALYPSNLLYLVFDPVTAFNLEVVLHFLLCCAGTYLLARVTGIKPVFALISGMLYGFCGLTLSRINLLPGFLAQSHLPFMMLFWYLFLRKRGAVYFALASFFSALQICTGVLELAGLSHALLLGFTLADPRIPGPRKRIVITWLMLLLFSIGLSAAQMLPTWEMVSLSSRGQGISYEIFSMWSLHPKRILEFIFPGVLGQTDALSNIHYWGRKLEEIYPPYILSIYFGFCLPLAFLAAMPDEHSLLPARLKKFLLVFLLFSMILALGRFLPFFRFLYESIPPLSKLRFPVKLLYGMTLPVAILAAAQCQSFFHAPGAADRRRLIALWILFAAVLGLTLLSYGSGTVFVEMASGWFGNQLTETNQESLRASLIHTCLIWALCILIFQYTLFKRTGWQPWLIAGTIAADLILAGATVNVYAPREFFEKQPAIVSAIRNSIGDGKLYREQILTRIRLALPENKILWGYRWDIEVLKDYLASFYRIPVIFHTDYDELQQLTLKKLTLHVHSLPWEQRSKLLIAAGVTLVLTHEEINSPELKRIAVLRNQSNLQFVLYSIANPLPEIAFVSEAVQASSFEEAVEIMKRPGYNPLEKVVLTGGPRHAEQQKCSPAEISRTAKSYNKSRYTIHAFCDGYLVFTTPAYPGWVATIDDKPQQILTANGAFTAIRIQKGKHFVSRRFAPVTVKWGTAISLAFASLLIVFWSFSRFRGNNE